MKFRIWMLVMVVVPIVLTSFSLTTFFVITRLNSLEEELLSRGRALARQVAAGSEFGLFSGNRPMIETVAAAALRDPDVDAILVRDEAGVVMARLGDERAIGIALKGSPVAGHLVSSEDVRRQVTPLDDLYLVSNGDGLANTANAPKGENSAGKVMVIMTTESLSKSRTNTIVTAILVTALLSALAVALALAYVRRFGNRLVQLSQTVARIGEGDHLAKATLEGEMSRGQVQELEVLAGGIDVMASQIHVSHRELARRVAEATVELEERRSDAERANLAKSRFLAAASHDLRQPLHALGLFADQLSRRGLEGEDGQLVSRIVESAGALSELLDALLDISRLDAGAMTPKFAPVALAPLLLRLRGDFGVQAENKGLRFRVTQSNAWVTADPMMLERVLINLVSNAIRYTPKGSVFVAVRWRPEGQLRIEVRDSGIGIHRDAQKLIFDEFVQLSNPERDRNKGLGLGLSIVQRMCQLMKIRFGVKSKIGHGSVFWLDFAVTKPTAQEATETGAAELQLSPALPSEQLIAVVDDDPLVLQSLCDQLQSWGFEVCAGRSGTDILAAVQARGALPQLLLCDYRLQGNELGTELIDRLRTLWGIRLPAVLMSGESAQGDGDTLKGAEYPVLLKPVRPARLRAVVQGQLTASATDR